MLSILLPTFHCYPGTWLYVSESDLIALDFDISFQSKIGLDDNQIPLSNQLCAVSVALLYYEMQSGPI